MRLYYAQNREDLLIKSFFPDVKNGFYIDVGANDPTIDSVTKLLYDEGWSGINVEPIRRLAMALEQARPRDITLQIGLSDQSGNLTFTEYPEGNGLSTFDTLMRSYYKQEKHNFPTDKIKEYEVPVKTLNEILGELNPAHIHALKIDVEGYEYEVIQGNNWKKNRPELICIEANHINKDWRPTLARNKYQKVFFDGVNSYYLAEESAHRQKFFNYPDIAFSGNPVYYPSFLEIEEENRKATESKLQPLLARIRDQEEQITGLHQQQRDVRFLAKRLAEEVQVRLNKRAKRTKQSAGLSYAHDTTIQQKVTHPDQSGVGLVAFIHERDKKNIRRQPARPSDALKPIPWKVAAWLFTGILIVAKKNAKRVR